MAEISLANAVLKTVPQIFSWLIRAAALDEMHYLPGKSNSLMFKIFAESLANKIPRTNLL